MSSLTSQVSGSGLQVPGTRPEVVLFDAGGTLVLVDPDRFNRFLAERELAPVDADRLFTAHFQAMSEFASRLESGDRLGFRWWVERFFELTQTPFTEEMAGGFGGGADMWNYPIPGARETVSQLLELGYRVAVVSNSDGTVARALELAGFGDLFELVIDSTDVGVSKPDPAIFRIALGRLGVAPEQVWYVGDSHYHDMGGARAAGLAAGVLIDPLALAPPGHISVGSITDLIRLLVDA